MGNLRTIDGGNKDRRREPRIDVDIALTYGASTLAAIASSKKPAPAKSA